jgi:arylsulfatase A-like enzyme
MSNRNLLLASAFLALFADCMAAVSLAAEAAGQRPNILFIMSDDHAYQAIGAYGSNRNETPNIDRLAKEGMRFDRAFVTNSICGPSRAVILTGKYSHLNGFHDNSGQAWFNGKQQTAPKLLQAAGYQTAVIGKWHLNSDPTGFDYWHILIGQGPYYNPRMKTSDGFVQHDGYTTDIITDVALDWLQTKRDPNKPFLLMYQHKAPHRNWQPAARHLEKYRDEKIPEPETLFDDYSGREKPAAENQMSIARHLTPHDLKLVPQPGLTPEQQAAFDEAYGPENEALKKALLTPKQQTQWNYQRFVKDYLRCVDAVDENVGRVLDYLDQSGLAENTVVIYTSDQGWYLGEHGWYDKRWMYEESFRTPLLIRWPGKTKAGSTSDKMVMNLDLAETFLDIAGVEVPPDMQGASLVPILRGEETPDWRKSVYYHYYEFPQPHHVHPHYGVRTERYKLIHFYTIDAWELFDLQKDPHELKSVYHDPAYAETVDELKKELARLRDHYKDDGTVVKFERDPAQPPPKGKAKGKAKAKIS